MLYSFAGLFLKYTERLLFYVNIFNYKFDMLIDLLMTINDVNF